jgi:hypothetical protein
VVGKWLPPLQSHAIEWARGWVGVIAALHHAIDKVEKPSLDGIRDNDPDLQHHVPIIISSLSFFCLLYLSSSQSTISLRLLPPYAPQNEISMFVSSYGLYRVRCRNPRFPPQWLIIPPRFQVTISSLPAPDGPTWIPITTLREWSSKNNP